MTDNLSHIETWHGLYRDIAFDVSHHAVSDFQRKGIWNYYILIPVDQLIEADRANFVLEPHEWNRKRHGCPADVRYHYESLPDLDLHGGCTFYDIIGSPGPRVVKIGCDYAHLWDNDAGYPADLKRCVDDAKHSIGVLWEVVPDMLRRCYYLGGFWKPGEGEETEHGWLSHAGKQRMGADNATEEVGT